jgi:hypothetical protein
VPAAGVVAARAAEALALANGASGPCALAYGS